MLETSLESAVKVDAACAAAVDLARDAAEQEWSGTVGDHLAAVGAADRVVTHYFDCTAPGYRGWRWAVTVARAPRSKDVTVDEACLVVGPDSIVAPPWVPWAERVQPGDLGVGDVLPTPIDDPRLVAGYTGDDELDGLADRSPLHPSEWEMGLGRLRVLSQYGRDVAADRWQSGDRGPTSPMAKSATDRCASCGFLVTIGGAFGQAFGVCANELSPADGCVVALDYGCGAHSEAVVPVVEERDGDVVVDEVNYDVLDLGHS